MSDGFWSAVAGVDHAGVAQVSEVSSHGDVGIAHGADGREVVISDGVAYASGDDGPASPLPRDASLESCQVAFFDHYSPVFLANDLASLSDLLRSLDVRRVVSRSPEAIFVLMATGSFGEVDVKCDDGRVLDFIGLEGTLVGVRMPVSLGSVSNVGWHLHLLSQGRKIAGHLLGFDGASLACQVCRYDECSVRLPSARCAARSPMAFA
jgi:acetolactate decarboxylase